MSLLLLFRAENPDRSGTAAITQAHTVTATGTTLIAKSGTAAITQPTATTGTGRKNASSAATVTQAHTVTATGQQILTRAGSASPVIQPTAVTATGAKGGRGPAAVATGEPLTDGTGSKAAQSTAGTTQVTATTATGAQGLLNRTGTAIVIVNHTTTASGVKADTAPEPTRRRGGVRFRPVEDDPQVDRQTETGAAHIRCRSTVAAGGRSGRAGPALTAFVAWTRGDGRAARAGSVHAPIHTATLTGMGRARHTERQRREDELLLIGAL